MLKFPNFVAKIQRKNGKKKRMEIFIVVMAMKEQKILEKMEECLDYDVNTFGLPHHSVGAYQDLSGDPYNEAKEANPEPDEMYFLYW